MALRYHNITKDDMLNGDGLRVVLWLAGCEHKCKNCQNPVTWDPNGGLEFDDAAKQEIFDYLSNDYATGITFSGGDPMATFNREAVFDFMREIKEKFPTKTIWSYTGYEFKDLMADPVAAKNVPELIDVLVDGKYEEDKRDVTYPWRGSTNQRAIDIKATYAAGNKNIIEIPLFNEFSDDTIQTFDKKNASCCG